MANMLNYAEIKANVNIIFGGGGQSKTIIYFLCIWKYFLQQKITNNPVLKGNSFPVFNIIKLISQLVTVTTDLSL